MNIRLHIERLILDGLDIGSDRGAVIKAAVEAELTRLMSEGGLAPDLRSGGALPSVRADALEHTGRHDPAQLGQAIARSVYGGIGAPK